MKKTIFILAVATVLFLSAFTFMVATNFKIANTYSIKFTSDDPSGVFTSLKGDISFDEKHLAASKFDVTIDPASINTGNGMKNKNATSANWFDVAKYPTIKFTSNKITKKGDGFEVTGTLDMHGVQKQITFPFTFKDNVFAATFNIVRTDFNIGGTTGPGASTATSLKVDVSVPVTQ